MSKRRGNGEGSVYFNNSRKKWHGQLFLPNGKRKNVFGETKKDVQNILAQLRREVDAGMHSPQSSTTFAVYCQQWYELNRQRLAATTRVSYESLIRNHIPRLGEIELAQLKPTDLTRVYREMMNETIRGNKLRSGKTVLNFHRLCHEVLKDAEREELILRNPADRVRAPSAQSKEIEPYSEQEAMQLIEKSKEHRLWAAIVVSLTMGLREGELLGLQWDDIDWERQLLHVRQQLKRVEKTYQLLRTKSYASRRTLPLPAYTQMALKQQKERLKEEQDIVGEAWEHNDFIFPSQVGQPLHPTVFLHQFRKICQMVHVPERRPHDMRHTFATLLLERGVNIKVVSELLGHSSIDITLRIYGHVTPRMRGTAIDEMNAMLPVIPTIQDIRMVINQDIKNV